MKNATEVLEFAGKNNIVMVDLKFTDWPGTWQHFSVPLHELEISSFEDGFGFDGSSIRGWQAIDASDMLVIPDPTTAMLDPFTEHPTLSMVCDIVKAVNYLKMTGIGDTIFFGPEAEFFILDSARFETTANSGYYFVDSIEGRWNSGLQAPLQGGLLPGLALGHAAGHPHRDGDGDGAGRDRGRVPAPRGGDRRPGRDRHEVQPAGDDGRPADALQVHRQERGAPLRHGMTATFMPKPLFDDNGSGMHCHQSIWKGGKPLFAGDQYAGFSEMGLYYIGGILKHAKAIAAFTNPTTNSYKRLTPGFEAPVNLAYSSRNRSAACRIPMYSQGQARGGALPGSVVQPLPGLRGDGDGGDRRHREQDPPG
jgi:glutamine synthetase